LQHQNSLSCGTYSNIYGTTTSGIIRWWDSPSGGNLVGTSQSGLFLTLLPLVSTTYYAEAFNYNTVSQTFAYTGSIASWTVPAGVTSLNIDVSGAQGGTYSSYGTGGLGGRIQSSLNVSMGNILFFSSGDKVQIIQEVGMVEEAGVLLMEVAAVVLQISGLAVPHWQTGLLLQEEVAVMVTIIQLLMEELVED